MTNSSYDAVPYQSNSFAQSRPEQLAVLAQLIGLWPTLPSSVHILALLDGQTSREKLASVLLYRTAQKAFTLM